MDITLTDALLTAVIALVGWNIRETYKLNASFARNDERLARNDLRLTALESRVMKLERNK